MRSEDAAIPLALRAQARLLRQGSKLHDMSLMLTAIALLLLGAVSMFGWRASPSPGLGVLLVVTVLTGIAELYCAVRVGFDAGLLDALSEEDPDAAANKADAALQALGLQPPHKSGRTWPERLLGARRLLLCQALALAAQLVLLLAAILAIHLSLT